jgi:DUF971 family protein
MFKIEKNDFGYRLTFSDFIKEDEMKQWLEESRSTLINSSGSFGVFVDMRTLKPLTPEAQVHMQEGQKLYKQKGMVRSVVILNNPIIKMQFQRIGKETGIYEWERYIDASSKPNWEQVGIDWISKGVDPDK